MTKQTHENLNALENKMAESGYAVIINHFLPEGVVVEIPPNAAFRKAAKYNCNTDKTLTVLDRHLLKLIIYGGIILTCCLFGFLMKSEPKANYRSYQNLKPNDVTEIKTAPISEMTVLETHTQDDMPQRNGIFGNRKVKIGDKVSNQPIAGNNYVDSEEHARNFNTPLLIVADTSRTGSGGRSFSGEKLAIPANSFAHVYLERDLMTGNLTAPVSAIAYVDLKTNGKTLVPKDSRLIGQCQKINGNRIQIRFDSVIFPDGKQYAVDGQALGEDNIVGVAGDLNHNITKKGGNMFASSLLDATAKSLNLSGNSFGTLFAGNVADQTSDSLGNALDDSMTRSGASIRVAASSRFKVIFE